MYCTGPKRSIVQCSMISGRKAKQNQPWSKGQFSFNRGVSTSLTSVEDAATFKNLRKALCWMTTTPQTHSWKVISSRHSLTEGKLLNEVWFMLTYCATSTKHKKVLSAFDLFWEHKYLQSSPQRKIRTKEFILSIFLLIKVGIWEETMEMWHKDVSNL